MTEQIIDKWIDQQGITPGEWEYRKGKLSSKKGADIFSMITVWSTDPTHDHTEDNCKAESKLFANSRKSLRGWIMMAHVYKEFSTTCDKWTFQTACENILASTGKDWKTVANEIEEIQGPPVKPSCKTCSEAFQCEMNPHNSACVLCSIGTPRSNSIGLKNNYRSEV